MSEKNAMDAEYLEYVDAYLTFLERDRAREEATPPSYEGRVERSHGAHPPQGQYVIDPDYMEILDLEPHELFRRFK